MRAIHYTILSYPFYWHKLLEKDSHLYSGSPGASSPAGPEQQVFLNNGCSFGVMTSTVNVLSSQKTFHCSNNDINMLPLCFQDHITCACRPSILNRCPSLRRSWSARPCRQLWNETPGGGYTLVSRPFMSTVQCSLLFFRCLGGIIGLFLSVGGRTPSSSCMSRATSGGMSSRFAPEDGGW